MHCEPDARTFALKGQKSRGDQQQLAAGQSEQNLPGSGGDFDVAGTESLEEALAHRLSSETPSLLPLVERIALAAMHDVTVLISGETGTGKTFLARLIHQYSPRRYHPFLAVPCGAIAGNLVDSELFGHVRGAFTGADRSRVGKFAAAGEGTLLLDEIDTLGLEQQATILRVVETGDFEPVGSNQTQKCLARLIVASNVDLEDAVERGTFRPDLYYRLNVMSFHLPPLRVRVEDISPLVRGMIAHFSRKFKRDVRKVSAEALACLEAFPWPGNIRQLENVVQQAVLVSTGPDLRFEHLPEPVREHGNVSPINRAGIVRADTKAPLHGELNRAERYLIQNALTQHDYRRTRTARFLGISRAGLFKKMRKYNLMWKPNDRAR